MFGVPMKNTFASFFSIIAIGAILISSAGADAFGKIRAIPAEEWMQTWLGLSGDRLNMIRLEVAPEGKGTIGVSFGNEAPCIYSIESWIYDEGKITIKSSAHGERCQLTSFEGYLSSDILTLVTRERKLKFSFSLMKEKELESRWASLKSGMQAQESVR
jgi:hypothetical protein